MEVAGWLLVGGAGEAQPWRRDASISSITTSPLCVDTSSSAASFNPSLLFSIVFHIVCCSPRFPLLPLQNPPQEFRCYFNMAGGPRLSPMIQREMADRAANTSARRVAEEYEAARLRLSDQTFNMLSYPDPLVPRKQSTTYPPGVTPEMEKKWLQVIEQSKK